MENSQLCPIWRTEAEVIRNASGGNGAGACHVTSPRAGGKYSITDLVSASLSSADGHLKIKITSWILNQNKYGNIPVITQKIIEEAASWPKSKVWDRADNLLRYLSNQSVWLGDTIFVQSSGFKMTVDTVHELLAWTGSYKFTEVVILAESAEREGWLELKKSEYNSSFNDCSTTHAVYQFILQTSGYARLFELEGANPVSTQAFVAMWFDDSMKSAYEDGLKSAIESAGFEPIRIDGVEHANKIDDEIIAAIRRARFVVADFTSESEKPRGGVYFEAGFALGLNIPVIWTCRIDMIDKVHFDTRQYNHITWENPQELHDKLKNRIEAVIGDGPKKIGNL